MGPVTTGLPSCTLVAPGSFNNPCENQACYCPIAGAGIVVPPLTSVISGGTTTTDCSYTTVPSIDNCAPPPTATSAPLSTTLATSTTAAVSPTVGSAVCNIYETSYSHCRTNISPDEVNTTANWMIGHQLPNGPMLSGSSNVTEVLTKDGLHYFMKIGWIPGCDLVDSQDAANPIATADILWETYTNCSSYNGIGGTRTPVAKKDIVSFPNKIAGVSGSPPPPANYWNNPVYC